ncbi:biogenesis of lysosome-related organelles complex 1 subunit 2 isoform X2 [Parasteatoda tepidariorum]|uniref:biogenesis of lysosome-related organelles complex 1 subunit 2 isoform X2 n=1 Tax=Parasteatoda tepidariorum TaxID=114398 RepID=UPI0039BC755B
MFPQQINTSGGTDPGVSLSSGLVQNYKATELNIAAAGRTSRIGGPQVEHPYNIVFLVRIAQDDYKLLTELNKECDMTYAGLRKIGGNLNKQLKEMTEKHAALKPYLEMIDSINESTSKLEAVAYMMDAYTKRLEAKFKSLEKR